MIERKTWEEFREQGFLWWINMILHTLGWSICINMDSDGNVSDVYPARVKFRGFAEDTNTNGYIKISEYIKENADDLLKEAKE